MKRFLVERLNLKQRVFSWTGILVATLVTLACGSFALELHQARQAVHQYVGIWEDDIARSRLFKQDTSLQNKILKQLAEVHPAVEPIVAEASGCRLGSQAPITYNSLPMGTLQVCFKPTTLAGRALLSPFMMFSVLLVMFFVALGWRRDFAARLQEQALKSELALNKEIAQISRQVAHDIRGPLTALKTLAQLSHEMSPEKQELFHMALNRIQGTAEDLLKRGQKPLVPDHSVPSEAEKNLSDLVEELLKEYRFAHPEVRWGFHNHLSEDGLAGGVERLKLQRILSNVFNNALEARPETEPSIDVTLMERMDHVLLQVMDNGCGIPEEILPRLMTEGFSHGKEQGHGLGLYDARKTLQAVGGDLQVRSRYGVGTQVILLIPKKEPGREGAARGSA